MPVRRSSLPRLAFLLLVPSAPACEDGLPERGPPIEAEDEGDELEEAQVCIEQCYPIKQECEPGFSCLPDDPGFSCQQLPSVVDGVRRGLHDTCEVSSQTCNAGLLCVQAAAPGCTGGNGCCLAICDINAPECPEGTTCYPFYEAAQMCYPNVGVCVL